MISFFNDYGQTGHDAVLSALQGRQEQTFPGYGEDEVCQEVANQIRACVGLRRLPFTSFPAAPRPTSP